MGSLRWLWPVGVLAALLVGPWACHRARPEIRMPVVVVDKTVPFPNYVEHRSLYWLMDHLKIRRPDGAPYRPERDYVGTVPSPVPGRPPLACDPLDAATAAGARLVYLADTYGVYEDDLRSGAAMRAALEPSPRIVGGLEPAEALAVRAALAGGATVVAEFNTMASPTSRQARRILEEILGVRWTGWAGRYFPRLEDEGEVPPPFRRRYEDVHGGRWSFRGPGFVLVENGGGIVVLQAGRDVEARGLVIEPATPVDPVLHEAGRRVGYPYWFSVVRAGADAGVLAEFAWKTTPRGKARLAEAGLPRRFPAVTRRLHPGGGAAYYFAGDFADNPIASAPVPLAGYPRLRRWLERWSLAPSESDFYWRFYVPLMQAVFREAAHGAMEE